MRNIFSCFGYRRVGKAGDVQCQRGKGIRACMHHLHLFRKSVLMLLFCVGTAGEYRDLLPPPPKKICICLRVLIVSLSLRCCYRNAGVRFESEMSLVEMQWININDLTCIVLAVILAC